MLDKINNVANNSFSYFYNVIKNNKAILVINSEQGLVYSIRLNKKKLLTKAFNLDYVLIEF
jgi:hypothetical protein